MEQVANKRKIPYYDYQNPRSSDGPQKSAMEGSFLGLMNPQSIKLRLLCWNLTIMPVFLLLSG